MEDAALTALGFKGRAGFQYNYDLCLMVEYGPRVNDALNLTLNPRPGLAHALALIDRHMTALRPNPHQRPSLSPA
jgi:hypothetical protein